MDVKSYWKFSQPLLSVVPAKKGIKQNIRRRSTMNLGHYIVGFTGEVGELIEALLGVISGATTLLKADQTNVREELGDLLFYLVGACKTAKVKLPTSTKRVRLPGTRAENLLKLVVLSAHLLDCHKKIYYGRVYDQEKIKAVLKELVPLTWGLCVMLTESTPDQLMDENRDKLTARYPKGFNPENEIHRSPEQEAAAVAKAKRLKEVKEKQQKAA